MFRKIFNIIELLLLSGTICLTGCRVWSHSVIISILLFAVAVAILGIACFGNSTLKGMIMPPLGSLTMDLALIIVFALTYSTDSFVCEPESLLLLGLGVVIPAVDFIAILLNRKWEQAYPNEKNKFVKAADMLLIDKTPKANGKKSALLTFGESLLIIALFVVMAVLFRSQMIWVSIIAIICAVGVAGYLCTLNKRKIKILNPITDILFDLIIVNFSCVAIFDSETYGAIFALVAIIALFDLARGLLNRL